MRKNYALASTILFICAIGLFAFASRAASWYRYELERDTVHTVRSYDSRAADPAVSTYREFTDLAGKPCNEVEVQCRILSYQLHDWGDVFQSAMSNDGIRLEADSTGTLGVVIRTFGYPALVDFRPNRWYALDLRIDHTGRVRIAVDGVEKIAGVYEGEFSVSDITVGTGYNKSRKFDGMISDFRISCKYFSRELVVPQAVTAAATILAGICAFTAFIVLGYCLEGYLRSWSADGLNRAGKIGWMTLVLLVGFSGAVIFHYVQGQFLGRGFPENTFLPGPVTRFGDFYGVYDQWIRMHFNGVGYGLSYFPSTYLVADLFSWVSPAQAAAAVFLLAFTVFFSVYTFFNLKTDRLTETLKHMVLCLCSYPFLITFHTGNFEWVVFAGVALFIHFYVRQQYTLGTPFLALAISMKLMPAVFLVLLFAERRYRQIAYTVGWVLGLTLLPLLVFEGGLRSGLDGYLANLQASQKMYFDLMVRSGAGTHFGHSLFNAVRVFVPRNPTEITAMLTPYFAFTMLILAGISFYILRYERRLWKKVALLVIALNLLPYTSTDYKLLYVFIPLFLLINDPEPERLDLTYVILLSLLLIPKTYVFFNSNPLLKLDVVLNPAIMTVLLVLIIASRIAETKWDRSGGRVPG